MNSYLIESSDSLSLEEKVKDIIDTNNFNDASINTYDLDETIINNALDDLDTYNFLSPKKVIVIKNIDLLKYEDNKNEIEHLIKFITNKIEDVLLIITSKKLNNVSKITKELKKVCEYISFEFDSKDFIKKQFVGYKIDSATINLLDEMCLGDVTKLYNECSKLKSYKREEKEIKKEDVLALTVRKLGDSKDLTFAFSRVLAMRDVRQSLEKYRELLRYNIEPLSIIGLLASQIRIIYQVKLLEKDRLNDKEIAEQLGEKSDYRIKKTRELTRLYTEEELLLLMQKLSDIDFKIKTTDVDPNTLIELFILNINSI